MSTQTKVAAKSWGIFVDGNWLNEGETSEIRSPYDHSVVGEVHLGTISHAETAVQAAQRAFETTKKSAGYERKQILNAISEGIRARHEEFSQVMCLEAGKPIKTARVEVDRAIFTFAVAAEEATRIGVSGCRLIGKVRRPVERVLCGDFRLGRFWQLRRLTFH
jgi:acyl-CoA reductase-like NAD-dependent aldehyde dehydrogenase